jgi:AcrR family transcriptional regulator
MNGYERRTEAKKDKIRTAALELFSAYGAEKTSVSEIAAKAGVAPATIYNYFGSKEGLMKDTVIGVLEESWKSRRTLWESELPFPELVKRAISMSDGFFDRVSLETIKSLFESDPGTKKLVDDYNRNSYPSIVRLFLEKGRREGYVREDISLEATTVYLKMYQDLLMQPGLLKNRNKSLIKELVDLMIYGLAGRLGSRID